MIHNTHKSVAYQLETKDNPWIVWCVMLLFRARLLSGQSAMLIEPIVLRVKKRQRVKDRYIRDARKILREQHSQDLVPLICQGHPR